VGDDNWIMAYVHVAHDCIIGSHTIFANGVQLAGHVVVEDWAILGGTTLVHQFVNVGAHSFMGMGCHLSQDVLPYVLVAGVEPTAYGINITGLQRRGFSAEAITGLKQAYRTLFRKGLSLEEARRDLEAQVAGCPEVRLILDFLSRTKRGFTH